MFERARRSERAQAGGAADRGEGEAGSMLGREPDVGLDPGPRDHDLSKSRRPGAEPRGEANGEPRAHVGHGRASGLWHCQPSMFAAHLWPVGAAWL